MASDWGAGERKARGRPHTYSLFSQGETENSPSPLPLAASACGREDRHPLGIQGLVLSPPPPNPSPLMRLWREQMSQAGPTAQTPPSRALGEYLAEGRNWHAGPQKNLGAPRALAGPDLAAWASW